MASPLPHLLVLETATPVSSVALFRGNELLGCQEYAGEKVHARLITTLIQHLTEDCSLSLKELQAVAVSGGPGSYTGLRVGVSAAKGLCMALGLPLIAFSTLHSLAAQVQELAARERALICPMIDARRMEVYSALLDADLDEAEPVAARIVEAGFLSEKLKNRKVIFIGDGAAKCKSLLEAASPNAIVLSNSAATARSAGALIFSAWQQQKFEDLVTYEPFYLKEFATTIPKNPLQ